MGGSCPGDPETLSLPFFPNDFQVNCVPCRRLFEVHRRFADVLSPFFFYGSFPLRFHVPGPAILFPQQVVNKNFFIYCPVRAAAFYGGQGGFVIRTFFFFLFPRRKGDPCTPLFAHICIWTGFDQGGTALPARSGLFSPFPAWPESVFPCGESLFFPTGDGSSRGAWIVFGRRLVFFSIFLCLFCRGSRSC